MFDVKQPNGNAVMTFLVHTTEWYQRAAEQGIDWTWIKSASDRQAKDRNRTNVVKWWYRDTEYRNGVDENE